MLEQEGGSGKGTVVLVEVMVVVVEVVEVAVMTVVVVVAITGNIDNSAVNCADFGCVQMGDFTPGATPSCAG